MTAKGARLAVALVFLAGALSGAAALHFYRLRVERSLFGSRDVLAHVVAYSLDRELSLTDAQRAAVAQAVIAARGELLAAQRQLAPHVVDVFERTQERIRAALDPGQQARFDAIVAQRRALMKDVVGAPAPTPVTIRATPTAGALAPAAPEATPAAR